MPNFVNIACLIQKFSILALDSDCSVCRAGICYSELVSEILTNEQFRDNKEACENFQFDMETADRRNG